MTRIIAIFFASVIIMIEALSAPVYPRLMDLQLADGSSVLVTPIGDECWHGFITSDGRIIAEGTNGSYNYIKEKNICERLFALPRRSSKPNLPSLGRPRIPVLLVEYPDKPMSNSFDVIKHHFIESDSSACKYFVDQSNGMFDPQFDFYGVYLLPSARAIYGTNDSHGLDQGLGAMIIDAVTLSGDDIDWSRYDNNYDGEVDVCIVIYAGVGENQATGIVPSSIWPCQWSLSEVQEYGEDGCAPVTRNGVTIDKFAVFNEVYGWRDWGTELDGIGIFCHEFSHCLGLPDFYPTVNVSYYGMGNWSLMDNGCYNNRGYTPIGYSAYEKSFMGWLDYVIPRNDTKYVLPIFNQGNDIALIVESPINPNEYYVIENRAKKGWDEYMRDEGIMITHVSYVENRWDNNTVNNGDVQLVTIFAADNDLSYSSEDGDLYGIDNHELTDESEPASELFMTANGFATGSVGFMGKPITEIYLNDDGTATLWYTKGYPHEGIIGDVNDNGLVDVEDINATINIILKISAIADYPGSADMDGNGIIDVEDVNAIINIILKLVDAY